MSRMDLPLFVYGTLSFPEVVSSLLGRSAASRPARIHNYKRVCVKDKVYPALIKSQGGNVPGILLYDLTPPELTLLDAFEDDFYERVTEPVEVEGESVKASVYIVPEQNLSFVTDRLWDRDSFARQYLSRYEQMVAQYRLDYLKGHTGSQAFSQTA